MSEELNPNIGELVIGIRKMRKIVIYPLSIGDQLKMSETIANLVGLIATSQEITDGTAFISKILSLIQNNLKDFLKFVLEEGENPDDVLNEMSNVQAISLCEIIYSMNYEETLKKTKEIVMKVQNLKIQSPSMK
jgi:hypothetical protein